MRPEQRKRLREIHTFPSLVKYLREELDWPISADDFEDLTFEYTPEEIGIDEKNAAKIRSIRRLRPLTAKPADQPWGIFFVKFEPKRLPVVALRRVLGRLALKKRASANSDERAAWRADDLLFISSYGEGEERRISFAHFSQSESKADLPILRVLGWDDQDTALHLDDVAGTLSEQLCWPSDEFDADAWREEWRSAFTLRHREVITTSKALAVRLAELACAIRRRINTVLAIETQDGPVSKLMAAFQQTLVHDLDEDGFADMYAQTIAYGLLSARVASPAGDTADDLPGTMPITNPFLRELMETFLDVGGRKGKAGRGAGLDFDELGVGEVVDLLDSANMEAVVRDFGDRNPQEDPVIHFYELFLKEYDAKKRMQRGVFYTPRPVVSFIVRAVDELLRTELGLEDGLADTATWGEMVKRFDGLEIPEGAESSQAFVQILDPATGTGTFLVEIIDRIHETMTEKWEAEGHSATRIGQLWNKYVPKHLLPRLHGYELMMAPYAIAHMKIGLKLRETGYRFGSDACARIYLTNALEPPTDTFGTLAFAIPALAHEAAAVNAVKSDSVYTVVVGNPPYSLLSANMSDEARRLVEPYKFIDGDRIRERGALQFEKNIQDDYVKFIRLVEVTLAAAGCGVSGIVTNHAFIDNTTFRGLRWHLLQTFSQIYVLDLKGNANRGLEDGDRNVFDIQQGVSVSLLLGRPDFSEVAKVSHAYMLGDRETKYDTLLRGGVADWDWVGVECRPPLFFFTPSDGSEEEFLSGMGVDHLFDQQSAGIITARDHFVIDFDPTVLEERIRAFAESSLSDSDVLEEFGISSKKGWDVGKARASLAQVEDIAAHIHPVIYRPFDMRWIFYHPSLVWGQAWPTMRHMLDKDNVALMTTRKVEAGDFAHAAVVDGLAECHSVSMKEVNYVLPLYRFEESEMMGTLDTKRVCNLRTDAVTALIPDRQHRSEIRPEDVFGYVYAVLHSDNYRTRYADALRKYFPHIPRPASIDAFHDLGSLGVQLAHVHLGDALVGEGAKLTVLGEGDMIVEKVAYAEETVWVDRARSSGFSGVPEEVWQFRVGGYKVCEKWLKERRAKRGRHQRAAVVLGSEEIRQYSSVIGRVAKTLQIVAEIDRAVDRHGGWSAAFE